MSEKEKCPLPAFARYIWPGRDESLACYYHAAAILNISKAMGFPIQMIQIDATEATCESADDIPEKVLEGKSG